MLSTCCIFMRNKNILQKSEMKYILGQQVAVNRNPYLQHVSAYILGRYQLAVTDNGEQCS